jgi:plasmid stability protein
MAQLLVRKLETSLVQKLRRKAATHGISMEEEHRRILRQALTPRLPKKKKLSFKECLLGLSGALEDYDPSERTRDRHREIDL